jgi:hypothetical protein
VARHIFQACPVWIYTQSNITQAIVYVFVSFTNTRLLLAKIEKIYINVVVYKTQPRSQGFSLFVIGKAGKGPGTGRSHDFQHPDIVGVIIYNNNELENPKWPPT